MLLTAPTAIKVNVQGRGPLIAPPPVGFMPGADDDAPTPPVADSVDEDGRTLSSSAGLKYAESSSKLVERGMVVDDVPPRPSSLSTASTSVSEEVTTYGAGVGDESGTSKYTSTCFLSRVLGENNEGEV